MKFEHAVLTVAVACLGTACATAPMPYKTPVSASPPEGRVVVSQALNIFDASGSAKEEFVDGKATLEAIVSVMPNGSYNAGNVNFGGYERESTAMSSFDRAGLAMAAKNSTFLQGTSPLFDVLENDAMNAVGGTSGRAAIVVISDGLVTDYAGRDRGTQRTLESAAALAANRTGETCFHAVQEGSDERGAFVLEALSKTTSCGTFRTAASLDSASALQAFSREMYFGSGSAPRRETPVAAAMIDSDGDGVIDAKDECPGTLKAAKVDERGCWTLKGIQFAVNGAGIEGGFTTDLSDVITVLKANPDVRIRVDGHSDSDGSARYNQQLSEKRAASVRDYLVAEGGLEADRFEIKGFGESKPIVKNDSAANKRTNRRVELTVLD